VRRQFMAGDEDVEVCCKLFNLHSIGTR